MKFLLLIKPNVRNNRDNDNLDQAEIHRSNETLRSEMEQINTSLSLAKYKVEHNYSSYLIDYNSFNCNNFFFMKGDIVFVKYLKIPNFQIKTRTMRELRTV